MRKIYVVFFLSLTCSLVSFAKEYKEFKVGVGFGYGPLRKDHGGIFLTIEPAYHLIDDLTIGMRWEGGFLGGASGGIDNIGGVASLTLNGQYYLTPNKFRAFAGAGLGLYVVDREYYGRSTSKFGFYPRIGFDVGHFSMSMDYNFIPTASAKSDYDLRSFPVFRMGFFFGGGLINPGTSKDNFLFRFGLGSAINNAEGTSGGILFTLEPAILVNERLSIGLRNEIAKQIREMYGGIRESSILSFTMNGQYYFSTKKFRTYVGAGLGLYLAGEGLSETKFGFYPRVGFDYGHFSLALDYNLIEATKYYTYDFNNNYLGIRISCVLGGKI